MAISRSEAIILAGDTMQRFLSETREHTTDQARRYGLTLREYEGRWNVYSIDLDQWHVIVSDNGGRISQILDCSRV